MPCQTTEGTRIELRIKAEDKSPLARALEARVRMGAAVTVVWHEARLDLTHNRKASIAASARICRNKHGRTTTVAAPRLSFTVEANAPIAILGSSHDGRRWQEIRSGSDGPQSPGSLQPPRLCEHEVCTAPSCFDGERYDP